VSFDRGNIERRGSRLDDGRRVDRGVNNGTLGGAVRDFSSAAGNSDFLSTVNSAGLLRDRGDRSGHFYRLRLCQADNRGVG